MIREPFYSEDVEITLDNLRRVTDSKLFNAVCDAIDLVCDHGDSKLAKQELLITEAGTRIWKVNVLDSRYDFCILWESRGEIAIIHFIGEL